MKAFGGQKLIDAFPSENKFKSEIQAKVGILHGNKSPTWLSDEQYLQWGEDFYKEFDKELIKTT